MNRLLFSEPQQKNGLYMRSHKRIQGMLQAFSALFILLAILCHIAAEHAIAPVPWLIALLFLGLYMVDIRQSKGYLLIYEHEIRYRTTFGKTAKALSLSPTQYKIKIRPAAPKSGYSVKFIFLDTNDRPLFTYNAVSLYRTPLGTPQAQWEIDLFRIGCEIIDDREFIINR